MTTPRQHLAYPTPPTIRPLSWPPSRAVSSYATALSILTVGEPTLASSPVAPRVFTPQSVGGELAFQSLLLEGVLDLERPGVAVLSNQPSTPLVRALACLVPHTPGLCVGSVSALWVHTGKFSPTEVDVLYDKATVRPTVPEHIKLSRTSLPRTDVVLVGEVLVTTEVRTVVDLAGRFPTAALQDFLNCFAERTVLVNEALELLKKRPRFRNRVSALSSLSELLGHSSGLAKSR